LRLSLVGISHHVAPVELRERVALPLDRAATLARSLGDAVCLSTCNRTEVYVAGDDGRPALTSLEQLAGEPLQSVAYRMHDDAAAVHLFRVSAGLDSLVPGESEILGQVRAAYDAARPGPFLDRVFRQALELGKRVRAETAIGESPASVPAAAAALAQQVFGDLTGRRVLLVGAGRIGELAAGSLSARGATIAYVANRNLDAAHELAMRFGGEAVSLDDVPRTLGAVDVVLASTGAPATVIGAADLPPRHKRPLFFIDIAVPRDVEPGVDRLDDVYRYDIDDLKQVVDANLRERAREAQRAEALVEREVGKFLVRQGDVEVIPTIVSLRARLEEIRLVEVKRTLARLPDASPEQRAAIEALSTGIVNKILHAPITKLRESSRAGVSRTVLELVHELFGLGRHT
jgi:glutamyl-tRNA reductase